MNRPSREAIDFILRNTFQGAQADRAMAILKAAGIEEVKEAMQAFEAEHVEKRRDHRRVTPRIDKDEPILQGRGRLSVTGMTLAAQEVTGQPSRSIAKAISSGVVSMNMVHLARAAIVAGDTGGITKADWYEVIAKLAASSKRAGESDAQAFVRVTDSGDGLLLLKAHRLAPGPDYGGSAPVAKVETAKPQSPALQALNAKAAELRKAHPELTEAQAFTKVFEDPANVELRQDAREHDLRISMQALHG